MTEILNNEAVAEEFKVKGPVDMQAGRRAFVKSLGLGMAGAALVGAASTEKAEAQAGPTADVVYNFALNLEYLEAEFYVRAFFNRGLADADTTGNPALGPLGSVTGGRRVPFVAGGLVESYAREIANDEEAHVRYLRAILGPERRAARPAINLVDSFNTLARFSGLPQPFDAFANETNFLLAAYVFEDVGVTAYNGAVGLIRNNEFLEGVAGILAVEAYHAGLIRTVLAARGLFTQAQQISDLRDFFDGPTDLDQGIGGTAGDANIVPTDSNGLTIRRTPAQVLAIVYGDGGTATTGPRPGGFTPNGFNGALR